MYTEDEARKIGVVGWVKNTSKGTVTGQVQGPEEKVNSIKTPLPFTDLSHPYQGQEQHIKSTSFQGTDDWNTPRKSWLSKVGSPSSRIDRTNFSNEKTISKLEYSSFNIRY
ncbi:acylphosphatase-2 isoform X5 [Bos javanicus]|nr:acylphosphatase-2 isoform X5 [Bos javanicus]